MKGYVLPSNFLKAVFHKIYLVHSWILCPKWYYMMKWYYINLENGKVGSWVVTLAGKLELFAGTFETGYVL